MTIHPQIEPYLDNLERLLDPAHIEHTRTLQQQAFVYEPVDHIPTVITYPLPVSEWPLYTLKEIIFDRDKMLLNELRPLYASAKLKDDRLYGIRANYGTGLVASLFGCPIHVFDHALPIATALPCRSLETLLDRGIPEIESGYMGQALETVAYFREVLSPYHQLSRNIGSQLLDIQGPFDNACIVCGSQIFLDLYDRPRWVHDILQLMTDTIDRVVTIHREIDGCPMEEHDGAWNHLGGICVRNDSTVNLSGEQYNNHVAPFDRRLYGKTSGWMHWCGQASQWWPHVLEIPGLNGVNPYQGEYYNLKELYLQSREAGVAIVQWTTPVDSSCQDLIRTGFSRLYEAKTEKAALLAKERLYKTGHADEKMPPALPSANK